MGKKAARILRAAAALCCLLLLYGCGQGTAQKAPDLIQPAAAEPRILKFQVSGRLGPDMLTHAGTFAAKVEKLSGGTLRIDVSTQPADQETVASQECDLAILRSIQLAQIDSVFSMFSLPFLYDNNRHMSVALNSTEMLERLGDRLQQKEVLPLAAMYNGSAILVSNAHDLEQPDDFSGLVVAMRTDNADKLAIFEKLGAVVLPYAQPSLADLMGTTVEILPEDLTQPSDYVTIDTVEVEAIQALKLLKKPEMLYAVRSYHGLSPLWLTANADSWNSLSKFEQACLREGFAGLIAGVEDACLTSEEMLMEELESQGTAISKLDRQRVAQGIYGPDGYGTREYTPPVYFDVQLYQLIQTFI